MAITFVTNQGSSGGSGTLTCVNPGAVAVGDLLVAMIGWNGTTANVTPVISDNVNAGAWNLPAPLHFTALGVFIELVVAWIRCDTAGTPTVTTSATVNIPSIVGANSAFVGFTAADYGGAAQQINSWTGF